MDDRLHHVDGRRAGLETVKTGTYYGQIEANVQLINRMPYDNVYKNDPQSVYQAQASMISPLVIKLLEQ